MHRYYILAIFAVFLNLAAAKADHLRDSIGVENSKGKKIILHQVVAKDTYYSISRRYNISPKVIMSYNDDKFLSLGVIIKVPTDLPFSGPATAAKNSSTAKNQTAGNTAPDKPAANNNGSGKSTATDNTSPAAEDNTTLIEHAVQRKENLNMLANKYGTTVEEIKRVNNLKSINLQIGQVLKIPAKEGTATEEVQATPSPANTQAPAPANTTSSGKAAALGNAAASTVTPVPAASNRQPVNTTTVPAPAAQGQYKKPDTSKKTETAVKIAEQSAKQVVPAAAQEAPAAKDPLVVHTVAGNETMYSIATRYSLTLDQLKAKNNLTTNSLYVGQKLLISGQYPVKGEQMGDNGSLDPDSADAVKNPSLRLPPSRYGLSQMDEKGTGVWIIDPDLDSSKMLVLHRTAPIGTIMKITNPMSNRSTFAKVVGKFTENESTKDVIIVMTKAVADALGALDKRFLCNLTYGGQANEQ
ncbi:MAG: LysM peptidoglycan-binding domain-containing protein [Pedobacter sp.]|uniref:LysM peptidoglycan-binding domain-containing protein n=1 Tax=Pedobacter sp. TaxID=1411316 RepID=UPI0033908E2C